MSSFYSELRHLLVLLSSVYLCIVAYAMQCCPLEARLLLCAVDLSLVLVICSSISVVCGGDCSMFKFVYKGPYLS